MRRFWGPQDSETAGVASVVIWTLIDSYLCSVFSSLCVPRVGECGGGVDACAITIQSTIKLFSYVFGPMVLFAVLGFTCLRDGAPLVIAGYLIGVVAAHWLLAFLCVRILHI